MDALGRLSRRFPDGRLVSYVNNGDAFIDLPLTSGRSFRAFLTEPRVMYLAFSEPTIEEMTELKNRTVWPCD